MTETLHQEAARRIADAYAHLSSHYSALARAGLFGDEGTGAPVSESRPWSKMTEEERKLLTAAVSVAFPELPRGGSTQDVEFDRNHWQRKLGTLVSLVEAYGRAPNASLNHLVETVYAVVNINWYTQAPESEPYLDIAKLTVERTLATAIAAGIVVPGPNAPASLALAAPTAPPKPPDPATE